MSRATSVPPLLLPAFLVSLLAGMTRAQGEFVNFEAPQVKPIEIATIFEGGTARDLLLVCNTPDNSVEIYDANPPYRFLQRVPVGLGPVTVRWNEEMGKFFTCNFVGDSVSTVRLGPSFAPAQPTVVGLPISIAELERTDYVGDEPSDIAFLGPMYVAISLNSRSGASVRRTHDMSVITPIHDLIFNDPSGFKFAVKQPRMIETLPDGRVFALNFMGGHRAVPSQVYDLDLYMYDPTNPGEYPYRIAGGMGTTNHAFAVTRDGSRTFVVGTRAENMSAVGVQAVSQLKTGFVRSYLWVVDTIPGTQPEVVPEATAGEMPSDVLPSINLNQDYSQSGMAEVSRDEALSQPTDVLLVESDGSLDGVGIEKVFLTAYHSDKVAVLHPDSSAYGGWRIHRIPIELEDKRQDEGYGVAGPRGLAYSPNATDPRANGRPGLVFVANRLSNSVSVINPHTEEVIGQFSLQNDPTPVAIRRGRKFLYSAAQFSGNGMVTCASCHVDGRTDGLAWNLGDLNVGPKIPSWYHDGNGQTEKTMPNFPSDKGPMVTQTLQGLVNSQVNNEMQVLFTNAPYHWRGDKRRLNDFNEAFVNLQGMKDVGEPGDPKGISNGEMNEYAEFLNTIVHPPNPEQAWDRRQTGSLGNDPNDLTTGEGSLLGLKIYHNRSIVTGRSCVQCHTLPDGSSNTSSLVGLIPQTLGNIDQVHPIESAATRNLFQREMLLHRDFKIPTLPLVQTGNFGLLHTGDPLGGFLKSINDFVGNVFLPAMPGPDKVEQVESLIEFTRRMDTGIAPAAGLAYTFTPGDAVNLPVLGILEAQVAQANIGLAVYTRVNGVEKGYYYDLTTSPPSYREEGTSNTIRRAAFDEMSSKGAVVIAQATPVGSERRVANLKGVATVIQAKNESPSEITLEAMAPPTQWLEVTQLTGNLDPTPNAISLQSLRALQDSVIGSFGVPGLRHEPPRRFRVSGKNIRHGAMLYLSMVTTDSPKSYPVKFIRMPLFPTKFTSNGNPVWETTAEADAMITMALLNGGLWAPGVAGVMTGDLESRELLDPEQFNFFIAGVVNEDNTLNLPPVWQRLSIQDGR